MSRIRPQESIETATSMPLSAPRPMEIADARDDLLNVLYNLGTNKGNVQAIKIFLDVTMKLNPDSKSGFEAEDAIALLSSTDDADSES